jgi:hypothetical protein
MVKEKRKRRRMSVIKMKIMGSNLTNIQLTSTPTMEKVLCTKQ